MLMIRLQRVGRKNNPAFRVVVTEKTRGPKSGKNVELLGSYSPHTDESSIKADRVKHWIDQGAQTSGTVHNILVREKIIDGKKINVLPKKSPVVKEKEEVAEEAPKNEASGDAPEEDKEKESEEKPSNGPKKKEDTEEASVETEEEEKPPESAPAGDEADTPKA